METISKYNFHGIEYVELSELNDFLKQMHRNYDDQKVGYFIPEEDQRVAAHGALYHLSAILNKERNRWGMHEKLEETRKKREVKEEAERKARREKNKAEAIEQAENAIERTRTAIDKAEKLIDGLKDGQCEKPSEDAEKPNKRKAHCPGRYTVWYRTDDDITQHCMGFVRFEKGIPVYTNRPCKATWFTWRGVAEKVAEKCGDGFEVVDMWNQMTKEERLLRAIFHEDGMDGEDDEPGYHGDGTKAEDEDWEDE